MQVAELIETLGEREQKQKTTARIEAARAYQKLVEGLAHGKRINIDQVASILSDFGKTHDALKTDVVGKKNCIGAIKSREKAKIAESVVTECKNGLAEIQKQREKLIAHLEKPEAGWLAKLEEAAAVIRRGDHALGILQENHFDPVGEIELADLQRQRIEPAAVLRKKGEAVNAAKGQQSEARSHLNFLKRGARHESELESSQSYHASCAKKTAACETEVEIARQTLDRIDSAIETFKTN